MKFPFVCLVPALIFAVALLARTASVAADSPNDDMAARKDAFLQNRADWWSEVGYPLVQAEGKEWKLNEVEPCWAGAHAALVLKRSAEEVARADEFFQKAPVDWEVDPDMRLCQLLHSYYSFRNDADLSGAAKDHLLAIFGEKEAPRRIHPSVWNFRATENHAMMGHVWRLLVAQLNEDKAEAEALAGHISEFIIEHARKGWQEFYSPCYQEKQTGCLVMLFEWAEDERLRKLAGMMLNLLYAEQAVLTIDGVMGGPCTRAYGAEPVPGDNEANHNSRRDRMRSGQYTEAHLVFGAGTGHFYGVLGAMCLATGSFVPQRVVAHIGASGELRGVSEFRARKPGNKLAPVRRGEAAPSDDAFNARVYCWITPDFVLGASQEVPGRFGIAGDRPDSLNASLVVRGDPRKTIYFDCSDRPVHLFQHRNVLVGQNGTGQVYIATAMLGDRVERNGWVLLEDAKAYIALRPARGGYRWRRVESPYVFGEYLDFEDPAAPFVLEVAQPSDYGGDFEAFTSDILDNIITLAPNDGLTYESCSEGEHGPGASEFSVELRPGDLPLVDGTPVDLESYPALSCPQVQSEWDTGIVTISFGEERLILDFPKARSFGVL